MRMSQMGDANTCHCSDEVLNGWLGSSVEWLLKHPTQGAALVQQNEVLEGGS